MASNLSETEKKKKILQGVKIKFCNNTKKFRKLEKKKIVQLRNKLVVCKFAAIKLSKFLINNPIESKLK